MFESAPVFGLRIQASAALPGLASSSTVTPPDIRLFLRQTPGWLAALAGAPAEPKLICPDEDEEGRPFYVVSKLSDGSHYRLLYSDGAQFIVDCAGRRIWVDWPRTLSLDDVSEYLFGPVMGWVLRLRGSLCLHASAVAINGRAIAFVGASGAGKSTTAAGFAKRGRAVLADDVVAISGPPESFLVTPGRPELRLRPESIAALYGEEDARPEFSGRREKIRVDLKARGQQRSDKRLPLAVVYILSDENISGRHEARALTPRDAMMALIANTHAGRLLDLTARIEEFNLLAALVSHVRVCEVSRGIDIAQLPALCDVILADFYNYAAPALVTEEAGA